jgi:hypothetical protein
MTHNRVFTKECAPNDANIVLVDGTECQGHATTGHFESPFGGLAATEKRCFFLPQLCRYVGCDQLGIGPRMNPAVAARPESGRRDIVNYLFMKYYRGTARQKERFIHELLGSTTTQLVTDPASLRSSTSIVSSSSTSREEPSGCNSSSFVVAAGTDGMVPRLA